MGVKQKTPWIWGTSFSPSGKKVTNDRSDVTPTTHLGGGQALLNSTHQLTHSSGHSAGVASTGALLKEHSSRGGEEARSWCP